MRKLMIAAAAAAMIGSAQALSFDPIDCTEDVVNPETCPLVVYKLTASGKTVQDVDDGAYKAVATLKVSKGALAFNYNEACAEEGACCYDTARLYAQVKVGKTTTKVAVDDIAIGKWSVFGKNLDKALAYRTEIKKGKSVSLESDLELSFAGSVYAYGEDEDGLAVWEEADDALAFQAVAFGKFTCKVEYTKASEDKSACDPVNKDESCEAVWTPGNYSGWFVGQRTLVNDEQACFNCDCGEYDLFGGTWKATYQKKSVTDAAAQKLAFGKVLIDWDEI